MSANERSLSIMTYGGGELVPFSDRDGFEQLSGIDNIRAQIGRFGTEKFLSGGSFDVKKAFDVIPFGVQGRPQYPNTDVGTLISYHRRNELVFACIQKIAQAAIDPEPIVEQKKGKEWSPIPGHPLRGLLMRPNPLDDAASFMAALTTSENIAGRFIAEIVRDGQGLPAQLWPLDPSKCRPIPASDRSITIDGQTIPGKPKNGSPIAAWEWKDGTKKVILRPEDVLVRQNRDITSRFQALAPLAVALGSTDTDGAISDYVRAFFNNGGVPSGILTVKNRALSASEAEQKRQKWMSRYGRGGLGERGIAVLDQNAEYSKIGSNLDELESEVVRSIGESRICMVFGVPPILVGAYVGLKNVNQRASAREAQQDFWINTMSPYFKGLRSFLTWNLLTEFVPEERIRAEEIRVGWDMSQVMGLQEDTDKKQDRERKNFQSGGITQNEFRSALGREPDANGDFYIIPSSMNPATGEVLMARAEAKPVAQPAPGAGGDGNPPPDNAPPKSLTLDELAAKGEQIRDGQPFQFVKPEKSIARRRILEPGEESKVFMLGDLQLSREPKGVEAEIDLKAVALAPKKSAADIREVLLSLRKKLIADAVKDLAERDPGDAHSLILTPDPKVFKTIRKFLEVAYKRGRVLVDEEAVAQSKGKKTRRIAQDANSAYIIGADVKVAEVIDAEDDDFLDTLGDATISKVVNDVQSKAAAILAMLAVLRVAAEARRARIQATLDEGSTAYIEGAAASVANAAMNAGRDAEIQDRQDEIRSIMYSAILDVNTCDPCESADGEEADDVQALPPAPNDQCEGGDKCRCFHVAIFGAEE